MVYYLCVCVCVCVCVCERERERPSWSKWLFQAVHVPIRNNANTLTDGRSIVPHCMNLQPSSCPTCWHTCPPFKLLLEIHKPMQKHHHVLHLVTWTLTCWRRCCLLSCLRSSVLDLWLPWLVKYQTSTGNAHSDCYLCRPILRVTVFTKFFPDYHLLSSSEVSVHSCHARCERICSIMRMFIPAVGWPHLACWLVFCGGIMWHIVMLILKSGTAW